MWELLVNYFRKKLGYHVCEEYTRWKKVKVEFLRLPTKEESDYYSSINSPITSIIYIRTFQKRICTICGREEQKELLF